MKYVLATVKVPDQERQYYAAPIRKVQGAPRVVDQVTSLLDHAASFNTREEAEAMCKELDAGYNVVEVDGT